MRKLLVLGLVAGLAVSLIGPADAAKRKKKKKPPVVVAPAPVDVNYYLHRDKCEDSSDATTLSTGDDADGGDGCGAVESGVLTELYIASGVTPPSTPAGSTGPDTVVWEATDGIPLVLDATKDVRGEITMLSFKGLSQNPAAISAGQTKLHILVSGTTDGAVKTIGEATAEYLVTPDKSSYTVEFSIKPDAALDKATFTTLELTTTVRGTSVLNGFYSLEDPASFVTVPTLK